MTYVFYTSLNSQFKLNVTLCNYSELIGRISAITTVALWFILKSLSGAVRDIFHVNKK